MKRDQNPLDYFTWNDAEFLLPMEEVAWTGLQQRALLDSQTNERTSFPVKNLPLPGKVKSFPCLNVFLLHHLTFQDFHLCENQAKEIRIWWTSTSAQAYLAGQHKQPFLLEIVLTLTIQQKPEVPPYGQEPTEQNRFSCIYCTIT